MTWTVRRGEAMTVLADNMGGRIDDVLEVTAHLRPGNRATRMPSASPAAAVFEVTERAADSPVAGDPSGWTLFLGAAATDDLPLGFYMVDMRFVYGPDNEAVTPPIPVEIVEPATVRDDD